MHIWKPGKLLTLPHAEAMPTEPAGNGSTLPELLRDPHERGRIALLILLLALTAAWIDMLSSQGQNLSTSRVSDLQNTFLAGFHAAFIVCAAFAAIGIFTSLVRGNENKNRQTQPETQ